MTVVIKVVTPAFIHNLGLSGAPSSIPGSGFSNLRTPNGSVIKKINHHAMAKKMAVVTLSILYAECSSI
jgi:hypothetical protein